MTMLFALFALLLPQASATSGGLPRFPDIGNGQVVFTAGGDLWKVPVEGGVARQLTSEVGQERFARISPDGKWVAYTAEYEGESDVWVIPFEGGAPRRLTWHSGGYLDDIVWDWTPDSKHVLFTSRYQSVNRRFAQLYSVDVEHGGLPTPYPTSDVGAAKLLSDGKSYIFNRHFRNFRTWKRYTGGYQQDLWKWDATKNAAERLTEWPGTDTGIMVGDNDAIFFVSDRPRTGDDYSRRNLFRWVKSGEAEQLTTHTDYDVAWPSIDGSTIVYMYGGDLRLLDVDKKTDAKLELAIPDEALSTRKRRVDVSAEISLYMPGPQAKRVALVAHGDLFTVPAKEGPWREVLTGSEGRVWNAAWSPDGTRIAVIADYPSKDGKREHEIWLVDQSGTKPPKQLTSGNDAWMFDLRWSPDGEHLLYTDKRMRLWDVRVSNGTKALVDTGVADQITDASYSADGSWLAYVKPAENRYGNVWLYETATGKKVQVTDDFNDDYAPTWDPGGNYLFFGSRRNFDLVSNVFEFRMVHRLTDLLYVVRLKADGPDPLAPLSDEEVEPDGTPDFEPDKEEKKKDKRRRRRKADKVVLDPPSLRIDVDGIGSRVQRLPLTAGRYHRLQATEEALYFLSSEAVNVDDSTTALQRWHIEEQKHQDVLDGVVDFDLAASGEKLLYVSWDGGVGITDAAEGAGAGDRINTWGIQTWVDPRMEWANTVDEVRRYMRDFFYDPDMHGHDWDAIVKRYGALLDRAVASDDVLWLIGEMVAELNVGHAYVWGWDEIWRTPTAFLGADLKRTDEGIQIAHVLEGEPGNPARTSPLRAPGVDVRDGDWLVAIDGQPVGPDDNPYQWLVGMAGRPVRIEVNATPTRDGARTYEVRPSANESQLRYWDWVSSRRARVAERTEGRVGYLHVPDTARSGYTEFVRGLYAQHRSDGMVIDVRYNGGGYIPEMFIEHLTRPLYNTWVPRDGQDWRTPQVAVHGPMVCLVNGYAGSGGDAFPYYFKQFELGPLVGTTTWGGLVGIQGALPLLIGGGVTAPSFAFVDREGNWAVEREGVLPDLEVLDPPGALMRGEDPQLEAAIDRILEDLKDWENPVPGRPVTYPVRK